MSPNRPPARTPALTTRSARKFHYEAEFRPFSALLRNFCADARGAAPGRESRRLGAAFTLLLMVLFAVAGLFATTSVGRAQTPIPTIPGLGTTTTTRPPATQPPTTQPPPTAAPTVAPTEAPTEAPTVAPTVPAQPPETFPAPAIAPQQQVPLPVPRPPVTLRREPQVPLTPQQRAVRRAVFAAGLPSGTVVAGSYGIGLASVFLIAFLLISLSALSRAQRSRAVVSTGGTTMDRIRINNRLPIGFACLGLAVVVAILGYLGLSRNPDVNRQIPYLASAGMAVVILAAIGGSFIVAEQLRNDDRRMAELEEAVRLLAGAVAPALEAPARVAPAASRASEPKVYEPATSAEDTEIIETTPAARPQRVAKRISKERK